MFLNLVTASCGIVSICGNCKEHDCGTPLAVVGISITYWYQDSTPRATTRMPRDALYV